MFSGSIEMEHWVEMDKVSNADLSSSFFLFEFGDFFTHKVCTIDCRVLQLN